jgi:hypothetical protein
MILEREFRTDVFNGTLTSSQSPGAVEISQLSETQPLKQVILAGPPRTGTVYLTHGVSHTLPLPDGYTNASYLLCIFRVTGEVKVVVTSPDHAGSTVCVYGTTASPGVYSITDKVTQIIITDEHATDARKVEYSLYWLPDITLEASFRGIQSTGAMAAVT